MKLDEGWTESGDGNRLYWQRLSADVTPTAVLLFVHGLAEHSGRYRHVMEWFAGRGFDCWSFDYRGHGKSPGRRVHVDQFDEFLTDLQAAHRLIREACPELPLILIGHSQGGLITLRYTLNHPQDLAAVVVSSPFLGIHPASRPNTALRTVGHILSKIAPRLMLSKPPDPSLLSRDSEVGEAYLNDPLTSHTVSARWFTEVMAAHRDTLERAGELLVRTLAMQSGADRLADPAATRAWVNNTPPNLVDYIEWPGFYHEMFNEWDKELVFNRMELWMQARLLES